MPSDNQIMFVGLLAGAGAVLLLAIGLMSITIVPAGHVGVWDLFGKIRAEEIPSGFHIVNPLARVHKMSYKTQEYTMSIFSVMPFLSGYALVDEGQIQGRSDTIAALTKEGLTVELDMTINYHLEPTKADEVYSTIGKDYVNIIVRPKIRSSIREVIARYEAKNIYTEDRTKIEQEIFDMVAVDVEPRGIIIEKVLLRNVQLPTKLSDAIEAKLEAEQRIEQKEFEVQTEFQEAERKRVEARGIADANEIIANSLSTEYLEWYFITNIEKYEATTFIPIGDNGLPMFKEVSGGN